MSLDPAIREVLAIHVQGAPAESISFGATVTIVCGNELAAARWRSRTPDGRLPETLVPVQVVCMGGAA
jgi:hypothetical protein